MRKRSKSKNNLNLHKKFKNKIPPLQEEGGKNGKISNKQYRLQPIDNQKVQTNNNYVPQTEQLKIF